MLSRQAHVFLRFFHAEQMSKCSCSFVYWIYFPEKMVFLEVTIMTNMIDIHRLIVTIVTVIAAVHRHGIMMIVVVGDRAPMRESTTEIAFSCVMHAECLGSLRDASVSFLFYSFSTFLI